MSMKDANKAIKEYGKQPMEEFVNRFKNHYIRAMFKNYFNSNFNCNVWNLSKTSKKDNEFAIRNK